MVMTLHKITAGDGYLYLLKHTARGDGNDVANDAQTGKVTGKAAAYYTARGNPPGQWTGRGAHLLNLDGKQVTEEQMKALFGLGAHPDADAMIQAYLKEHVRAGMTARQLEEVRDAAIRHATLGRQFPLYEQLDPYDDRVNRRLDVIREQAGREPTRAEVSKAKVEEARRQRSAVAGFDLAFTPVKSASLLWAVDPRPEVREAIRTAHQNAVADAMNLIEDHAAYTRTGTGGLAQIETNGLIAASFEHWDSRAGDPNLHTHMAVSSKVQGTDGVWRSLDARTLYRLKVAASECYNTAFEAHLTSLLGVTFSPRPGTPAGKEPVREIDGVPPEMIDHFSRRRAQIDKRYDELLAWYRKENGREPDTGTARKLADQATVETRPDKQPPRSLKEHQDAWRAELAEEFGPDALDQLMRAVPSARPGPGTPAPVPLPDFNQLAERVLVSVASRRSTWTRWNVRAEAERVLRSEMPGLSPDNHTEFADILTDLALCHDESLLVEAPAMVDEPDQLRRSDGESVFTQHGAERFTSESVLAAEQRLLDATRTPSVNGLAGPSVAAAIDGFEAITGRKLDPGQRILVAAFACDDRLLLAGLGPAGAGKTTAMRAYAHVMHQAGRRIIPLATSAASADVLGKELSLPAENLHKFLHEWTDGPASDRLRNGDPVPEDLRQFALRPGDVVLIDEAGMAGTFLLDQLVTAAATHGATVRLLGDDRQLSAVESGGALRLIAAQPGTPELTVLHRFNDPAEAAATLQIRVGDGSAIDWYAASGRIRAGSRGAMIEAAYDGWKADMLAGKTTLMAAGDGTDVTALSARARADRVEAGQVEPGGVQLRDGNRAGTGDWIVTRENQRRLSMHGGRNWVKNGDAWLVERRHGDGALTVKNLEHGGRVTLPAEYVATQVQLLYATTGHRSQGDTVDTAHPLITPDMTREMLYVLASRARERTTLYTVTHEQPVDDDARTDQTRLNPGTWAAREVLLNVIATDGTAMSATETIQAAQDEAESLATLVPRYLHAAHLHAEARYRDATASVLGERDARDLVTDSAWGAVVRRLYDAEAAGWNPEVLLKTASDRRELATADSTAEVMAWRIDAILKDTPTPPSPSAPVEFPAAAKERLGALAAGMLGDPFADRARSEAAWPALIGALRRAEHAGHNAREILTGTAEARELRAAPSISELLARRVAQRVATAAVPAAARATGQEQRSVREKEVLPWVTGALAGPGQPGTMPAYLNDALEAISARAAEVADRSIRERPAWMAMLGQPPADPAQRAEWRRHVTVIAAYRDQHRVTTDDPRQVLGPYPASGHAGHKPYWHAAESVLQARRIAGLDHGHRHEHIDTTTAQIAADIYRSLPEPDRAEIAAVVAEQSGSILWLGDRNNPDEEAAVQPGYSDRLTATLIERGRMTAPAREGASAQASAREPAEAAYARRGRSRGPARSGGMERHQAARRAASLAAQRSATGIPLQRPEPIRPSGPVHRL